MPRFIFRLFLITTCLSFATLSAVSQTATTNAPATNAPTATPPSIATGDIVTKAQVDTATLQTAQAGLNPDTTLQTVEKKWNDLLHQIDSQNTKDGQLLAANPSLSNLQSSQRTWQGIADNLTSAQDDLSQRVSELDALLYKLGQMDGTWKATLDQQPKTNAPPEIAQRIKQVRSLIADTMKAVQTDLTALYSMQNRVAAQDTRSRTGLDAITKRIETAWGDLFKQDHPFLWDSDALLPAGGGMVAQERVSFHAQLVALQDYLQKMIGAVLIHLFVLAFVVMGFYWLRNAVHARAAQEPSLQRAELVFDQPLATGLLFALLAAFFLYPDAPRLFSAFMGAIALIPAVFVIRRLIDPSNFSLLYATVIAYFVDQVRLAVNPAGALARFLLLAELVALSIFLLTALRARHPGTSGVETDRLKRFTRLYLHIAFLLFVFAGFANVLGYIQLSVLIGHDGMLRSTYLAVILYAAVRILDALAITALSIRPFSRLGMVRHHHDQVYGNTTATLRWLVFGVWLLAALEFFRVIDPVWQFTYRALTQPISIFYLTFQLGSILAFPLTVWAAFLLSRFIRFCLEEELYPQLHLARGIPYAASTMVHYTILVLGFYLAAKATGVDLTQFTILAGAFGVGLGFGLQNILNNFVSGIILLFERPVKVGDIVQTDATTMGTVERIGIRASVIRLTNGSELIIPNGNLISNPVTNWTLSSCERLIEIPVSVNSPADPGHVADLLINTVKAHASVLKNPSPQALLATFTGAALGFKVRVWVDSEEEWMKLTSDLSLAIHAALDREKISIT